MRRGQRVWPDVQDFGLSLAYAFTFGGSPGQAARQFTPDLCRHMLAAAPAQYWRFHVAMSDGRGSDGHRRGILDWLLTLSYIEKAQPREIMVSLARLTTFLYLELFVTVSTANVSTCEVAPMTGIMTIDSVR